MPVISIELYNEVLCLVIEVYSPMAYRSLKVLSPIVSFISFKKTVYFFAKLVSF